MAERRTYRLVHAEARRRAALAQAMALGLPGLDIRRMAKLPEWQLAHQN